MRQRDEAHVVVVEGVRRGSVGERGGGDGRPNRGPEDPGLAAATRVRNLLDGPGCGLDGPGERHANRIEERGRRAAARGGRWRRAHDEFGENGDGRHGAPQATD